jgi:hypothetical protein
MIVKVREVMLMHLQWGPQLQISVADSPSDQTLAAKKPSDRDSPGFYGYQPE